MFGRSARFYDALYAFKDYEEASRRLSAIVRERVPDAQSLLDVGCGTGQHVAALTGKYDVEGLDISDDLLSIARGRCPNVRFHRADMTDFDLARQFDAVVCLFSAIGYVRTLDGMRNTLACFARHVRPGGCVVVEPWFTPEQYRTGTITFNVVEQPELKIAWMYTSRRAGNLSQLDIHYMVGTTDGIDMFTELHELGLFTHDEYRRAFMDAGLTVEHDPVGLFNRGLYIGTRPTAASQ
jgi:SAM-dependent methyltransferase